MLFDVAIVRFACKKWRASSVSQDPVCRNFYAELLRWPSRYRDYYCCERPADAAVACRKPDWKGHLDPLSLQLGLKLWSSQLPKKCRHLYIHTYIYIYTYVLRFVSISFTPNLDWFSKFTITIVTFSQFHVETWTSTELIRTQLVSV